MSTILSDADMAKLIAGSKVDAPETAPSSGRPLSDAELAQLAVKVPGFGAEISQAESFGRGAVEGATFGYDDKLGMDKERREASRNANPWTHFAGEIVGGSVPMVAAGPIGAAARGTSLAARGVRGVAGALTLGETGTVGQAALQSAKIGGVYGALSGSGHADVQPEDTMSEALLKRGKGALLHGAIGTVVGAPVGVAAYGASRAASGLANRILPDVEGQVAAARDPAMQGLKDIARDAGYDRVNTGELARSLTVQPPHRGISQEMTDRVIDQHLSGAPINDIATTSGLAGRDVQTIVEAFERDVAPRFRDLNLVEAIKQGPLQRNAVTGVEQPAVVSTRNLDRLQKWAANQEGQGAAEAEQAFMTRKNEMPSRMQQAIDQAFGSGNEQGRNAALERTRQAASLKFEKLRALEPDVAVQPPEFGPLLETTPFKRALEFAADNGKIRGEPGYQAGVHEIMTPAQILDVHKSLTMQGRPSGKPEMASQEYLAREARRRFVDLMENSFGNRRGKQWAEANQGWRQFRDLMTAREHADDMALVNGGRNAEPLTWLRERNDALAKAEATLKNAQEALNQAQLKVMNGAHRNTLNSAQGRVNKAIAEADHHRAVLSEFRANWGEALKDQIARSTNHNDFTNKLLTQEGQRRIVAALGPEQGRTFIQALTNFRTQQNLGNRLYGGPDTAFKQQHNERMQALADLVTSAIHMRPGGLLDATKRIASNAYQRQRADRVNRTLSGQGPEFLRQALRTLQAQEYARQRAQPYVGRPLISVGARSGGLLGGLLGDN